MSRTPSPWRAHVVGDLAVRALRRREHEADLVLHEQVADAIAHARLGAAIRDELKAERALIEVRGLLGVADVELDVVGAVDRKGVVRLRLSTGMVCVAILSPPLV